jgi:putative tryptophan/tyrosine transport system substrate-binding protein
VIGVLILADPDSFRVFDTAFRRGLSEIGSVAGRNVAIEYRWPGRDPARLSEMADDLVRRGVAVIVAASTPTAVAAQKPPNRSRSSFRSRPTQSSQALSRASIDPAEI